jgi:hypothetical protein
MTVSMPPILSYHTPLLLYAASFDAKQLLCFVLCDGRKPMKSKHLSVESRC